MNLDREQKHFQKQKWKKKKKYFFWSTNNRHVFLSNTDCIASKTFETIDEMSKNNCFANNDSTNCAEFSIIKNAQNFLKKKKIVATVERILKKKKSFKSLSRVIDKISNMLRLENVADSEDFASRKWIKNVSSKKMTFSASFLKLRIVLFILQLSRTAVDRMGLLPNDAYD
jgi:C4-dicarboxylate-specific signal transduction histidine kinase